MPATPLHRRSLITAAMAAGALAPAVGALAAGPRKSEAPAADKVASAAAPGLVPDAPGDQSQALQKAIDQAAQKGTALVLGPGRYRVQGIKLRPGTTLLGEGRRTVLALAGPGPLLLGDGAHGVRLERLALDGGQPAAEKSNPQSGLVELRSCRDIVVEDLSLAGSAANGLTLIACSGRIANSSFSHAAAAAILSLDSNGLAIVGNRIADCANNGILVWRSTDGEDGTLVEGNRIERIRAQAGGSGQNGNGINVFRAGSVLVTGNRITDCAYSAIRGNAASNIQMVANSCARIGEVALYAEFGFEGALIASNVIDGAASGISVTNFNEGGRLAIVQGNLVRNLKRREAEPHDKRGEGISVEADASVSGNTIEGAETAGIVIGFGRYMRDVVATSNVIRQSRVGVLISSDPAAGTVLVAQNLVSGATGGAIRLMHKGLAVGADLARVPPPPGRLSVSGNVAADGAA